RYRSDSLSLNMIDGPQGTSFLRRISSPFLFQMQIQLLKSKLLRAEVTDSSVDYEGSLGIDISLMDKVGLLPYEKILIGDITNGTRIETYASPAPADSCYNGLNGAAARLGAIGDLLVIMSFADMTPEEAATWQPTTIVLAERNSKILKSVNV